MADVYFTSTDGVTYTRRLYGRERMSAAATRHSDGLGQIVTMGEVELKSYLTQEKLAPYVKAAWTSLRFTVPWMAVLTTDIDPTDNSFLFTYKVPLDQDEIDAWTDKTIVWRTEELSFSEWEEVVKRTHWKPGDNRYGFEVHISLTTDGYWMMGLTAPHWVTDGRGILPVFDQFFKCLQAQFDGSAPPVNSIRWGEEVIRLPPTGVRIVPDVGPIPVSMDPPPAQFTRLSRKANEVDPNVESINRCIVLTKEQTEAFNLACKRHRCSITAAINSIFLLADLETELRCAADSKGDDWDQLLDSFHQADLFSLPFNVSDVRHFIYPLFTKISQPCGVGGLINCGFATYHDMNNIRNCLHVGKDGDIVKNYGPQSFWDGVVMDTRNVLREAVKTKATAKMYHHLSATAEAAAASVRGCQVPWPGVMASSLGSLDKLSLFTRFRPSVSKSDPGTAFSVRQWRFGIRTAWLCAIAINTWEYDGVLSLNLQGSSRWQTQQSWDYFSNAVTDAFERITSATSPL
ncbi:hypothetical protein D9758_004592 [Tetrapyrgos nigripes]|uniref:Uncharacterized protein n=1 Tax=Tetrapyrgos nigripes TaxID=182062 RepID=A0A8H5GZX1_9AGAR|nr:hypothetical protein D9758_004592 [Tetrapyrgos nigripes]